MSVAGKYFIIYSTTNGLLLKTGVQNADLTANVIMAKSWEMRDDKSEPYTGIPLDCIWSYERETKSLVNRANNLCLDVLLSNAKRPVAKLRPYHSARLTQQWTLNGQCLVNALGHSVHIHENDMARGFSVKFTAVENYRVDVGLGSPYPMGMWNTKDIQAEYFSIRTKDGKLLSIKEPSEYYCSCLCLHIPMVRRSLKLKLSRELMSGEEQHMIWYQDRDSLLRSRRSHKYLSLDTGRKLVLTSLRPYNPVRVSVGALVSSREPLQEIQSKFQPGHVFARGKTNLVVADLKFTAGVEWGFEYGTERPRHTVKERCEDDNGEAYKEDKEDTINQYKIKLYI